MHGRLRVAIVSTSAAILLGCAGIQASVAQAAVETPISARVSVSPQTDPPGPCDPSEQGQTKVGPDGQTYTCEPADPSQDNSAPENSDPGNTDPGNTDPGNSDPGNSDPT
jgi:hypothetical protein